MIIDYNQDKEDEPHSSCQHYECPYCGARDHYTHSINCPDGEYGDEYDTKE